MHTVTLTRLPDETSDDFEYTFGGTHGSDCQTFNRCKRKSCHAMNPDYGDERVRHGKDHFHRDGEWLVESGECALRYVFESRTDWETFDGVSLGTYPIRVEWEDDVWWIEVQDQNPVHPNGSIDA